MTLHAFEKSRSNMVEGQLLPNNVTDARIIQAMRTVPREKFVPVHMREKAYVDEDIAVGRGRYLPEPLVLGRLLQHAGVGAGDIVLDIGCGTGYSTAVLGRIAGTVVGIDTDEAMVREADRLLHDMDICNAVVIEQKDLRAGYPQQGPYNVILINGSVSAVPEEVKAQLAEGGRLVTVISNRGHMGSGVVILRQEGGFSSRRAFDAATPFLAGFEHRKTFVF